MRVDSIGNTEREREDSLESMSGLSLESPVRVTSGSALYTDLSNLISLTEYGRTTDLHHHNASCARLQKY